MNGDGREMLSHLHHARTIKPPQCSEILQRAFDELEILKALLEPCATLLVRFDCCYDCTTLKRFSFCGFHVLTIEPSVGFNSVKFFQLSELSCR